MAAQPKTTRDAPLQAAIVECVRDWKADPANDGNSPTYQDIAEKLGKRRSRIHEKVQRLIVLGELKINQHGKIVLGGKYLLPEQT